MELEPHVVIFPYDQQGHITPAFALARALASRGLRVTGVLTATRYSLLSPSPATDHPPLFHIVEIPDAPPPRASAAAADPDPLQEDDVCFQHSLQKLEPGLLYLLQHLRPAPSCLISDFLYPWTQDVADRLELPRFQSCAHVALAILLSNHFPTFISKGLLPFQPGMEDDTIDFIPGLSKQFRLGDVVGDFLLRDNKQLEVISRIQSSLKRAVGLVINTIYDLEPDFVNALSADGLSIYTVGPMAGMDWEGHRNNIPSVIPEDEGCLLWLDEQPLGAVVYVAFGSLVTLSEEETQEVALGLEACGQPFLWVLRPSSTVSDSMTALPAGFLERTKERGRVITWAPQAAVLAHASVGCFLTHCGLGSVLEALWAGVPIIGGLSKVSDHNTNLWLVTKLWRVGMALQDRDATPPLSIRCAVKMRVEEIIHGDKGKMISQNAAHMKAAIRKAVEPNGSSQRSLNKLVTALKSCSIPKAPPLKILSSAAPGEG